MTSGDRTPKAGRTVKINPAVIGSMNMPITNGGTSFNTVFSTFAVADPRNKYGDRKNIYFLIAVAAFPSFLYLNHP